MVPDSGIDCEAGDGFHENASKAAISNFVPIDIFIAFGKVSVMLYDMIDCVNRKSDGGEAVAEDETDFDSQSG
jgi:hypothetical protein